MSTTPHEARVQALLPNPQRNLLEACFRRLVIRRLAAMTRDRLSLHEGGDVLVFGEDRASAEIEASIHIHDCAFFSAVAFGGSIGAAESYARGEWTTNDLSALVRLFIRNRETLESVETGLARLAAPLRRRLH